MKPIIMPQVGQDIPSAKIIEWRKKEGERVEKGEIVLVVESDKASFEVEADESGVLLLVLHAEGEEVEIFKPLAYIGQPGEVPEVKEAEEAAAKEHPPAEPSKARAAPAPEVRAAPTRILASPSARRLAEERGIDLVQVKGSGPGSRITKRDVLAASRSVPVGQVVGAGVGGISHEDMVIPFSKRRQRIANRLTLSNQTIPHFYLFVAVDMSNALEWRKAAGEEHGTRITVTDMVIKACATALREFDKMNAYVDRDKMVIKKGVNVGVAVALDDGLLVPVIPDADKKSLREISALSKKNVEAARRGVISSDAVGTFTVTSLGPYGVQGFLPVINPPECGILAVGTIEKRVVPLEHGTSVRDMMTLVLASDHRAVDGTYAAQFLNRIKDYLQNIYETQKGWASL